VSYLPETNSEGDIHQMSRTFRNRPHWVNPETLAEWETFNTSQRRKRHHAALLRGDDGELPTHVAVGIKDGKLDHWEVTWGRYRRPAAKRDVSRIIRRTGKQALRQEVAYMLAEEEAFEQQEREALEAQEAMNAYYDDLDASHYAFADYDDGMLYEDLWGNEADYDEPYDPYAFGSCYDDDYIFEDEPFSVREDVATMLDRDTREGRASLVQQDEDRDLTPQEIDRMICAELGPRHGRSLTLADIVLDVVLSQNLKVIRNSQGATQ
jgi:hypothetical protein